MKNFSGVDIGINWHTGAIETLLIKLGGRCFGLPLQQVRHICPIPSSYPSYGASVEDYFVYQGDPLRYISLWNFFGLKSEYIEYEEMQAMLPLRRQDHLDWMDALEDAIRNGTQFSKARNPRECAFGKWYYGYHTKDLRLALLMRSFEHPHTTIHRLADTLLNTAGSGKIEDAIQGFQESRKTTLAELLGLFDSAQDLLSKLQRRIAIIVAEGNVACALGADQVKDIVVIPAERVKPSACAETSATPAMIILDDDDIVPLLNWPFFLTSNNFNSNGRSS